MRVTTDVRQKWQPTDTEPWNVSRVWHLHRRAGFGATWRELQRDQRDGVDASVDRFIKGEARTEYVPKDFYDVAEMIGYAAQRTQRVSRLKGWWVFRLIQSPDPLGERLTLMWHNHFATSLQKVRDVRLMWQQNKLLLSHCRANFPTLLRCVVMDPAMLIWLDAAANRKDHPNENLARELLELFTLGEGNYTETDVKETARCLTGLRVVNGQFKFSSQNFDDTEKTVLGHSDRFSCERLLEWLTDQPATSTRIAWRLCDMFFGDGVVNEALVKQVSEVLTEYNLNIGAAVDVILRSAIFFSDANMKSQIASPVDFAISTLRALELFEPPPNTVGFAKHIDQMGQKLFEPPNVFGWTGGRAWINTRSLVGRRRFIQSVLAGELQSVKSAANIEALVKRHDVDSSSFCEMMLPLLTGRDGRSAKTVRLGELQNWVGEQLASADAQLQ